MIGGRVGLVGPGIIGSAIPAPRLKDSPRGIRQDIVPNVHLNYSGIPETPSPDAPGAFSHSPTRGHLVPGSGAQFRIPSPQRVGEGEGAVPTCKATSRLIRINRWTPNRAGQALVYENAPCKGDAGGWA